MGARFDELAKDIFLEALSAIGTVRRQYEVAGASQAVDTRFEPDPARVDAGAELGWLGAMARRSSLFEAFHEAPDLGEVRACLRKQLTLHHAESVRARRKNVALPTFPHLWILTAGRPDQVLAGYDFRPMAGFPRGFLERGPADAVSLVLLRDLPRARDTLLLRLMASGKVLEEAMAELERLPTGARERAVALPPLVAFRGRIPQDPSGDEEAFLMSMQPMYEQWKQQIMDAGRNEGLAEGRNEGLAEGRNEGLAEGRNEGLAEGRNEGLAEGQRGLLRQLLRARFGELPEGVLQLVAAADPAKVGRWALRVLSATSLDDVVREG